jgi:hypothetical protein
MAKFDITKNVQAADTLMPKLTTPLQRRILANYRRHAIMEVSGEWEGIFDPEMTIENPVYLIDHGLMAGKPIGVEEVKIVYQTMKENGLNVIVVENEIIAVSDYSFTHEADFHQFVRGPMAKEMGYQDALPDAWYQVSVHVVGMWHYDEQARLIGEHGGVIGQPSFVVIPEEEVITLEEARSKLMPLINELPPLSAAA